MNQTEARRYVAEQYGIEPARLSSLLDAVAPTTDEAWSYIAGQTGHTSAQELRGACLQYGAYVVAPA